MIALIGGKYRSRKIATPDSSTTLPTKNMVREAMFSALHELRGEKVLDLYAGSGALGLEALSRGAENCLFVEKDKNASKVIKGNIDALKETHALLWNLDAKEGLEKAKKEGMRFSLILLDPPYKMKEAYQEDIDFLRENAMLCPASRAILEYEGEIPFDLSPFPFAKEYRYGKSRFLYIKF